ncbi:MAG: hypothetical protein ACKVJU_06270 [Verrucomicrobiales bacterium]
MGSPIICAQGDSAVTLGHVFQQVDLVRSELDLIRLELEKSEPNPPPPVNVEGAEPREVFFQALTLFRKANQMAFEHTREGGESPTIPNREINPGDVQEVVTKALQRIRRIKESLSISEQAELPGLDSSVTPSQVFEAIVSANRELNQLLDRPFAPEDVYEQITVAIGYATRLLDTKEARSTPPEPPQFERRKQPAHVYLELVKCFDEIHQIGEVCNAPMLNLQLQNESEFASAEPGDVYDMASLLVSELIYLHQLREHPGPPRKVYDLGRKTPSHVYQRVGILRKQMTSLRRRVDETPSLLSDEMAASTSSSNNTTKNRSFWSENLGARLLRSHLTAAAIGLTLLGFVLVFTLYVRSQTVDLVRINALLANASHCGFAGAGEIFVIPARLDCTSRSEFCDEQAPGLDGAN